MYLSTCYFIYGLISVNDFGKIQDACMSNAYTSTSSCGTYWYERLTVNLLPAFQLHYYYTRSRAAIQSLMIQIKGR